MSAVLLTALWIHLAASVLLTGGFFVLLLAGASGSTAARNFDRAVVGWSRRLIVLALVSGVVWLLVRTALFENRVHAVLEPRAVWHAVGRYLHEQIRERHLAAGPAIREQAARFD